MATSKPVEVSLCPNESLAAGSNPTWPRPAGVRVRFTNEANADDSPEISTDADGCASAELAGGARYAVEVSGDEWEWWEPAQQPLTVPRNAGEAIAVKLVPRDDDLWLVALRLCRQRPGGQPVAGAEVTVTGPAAGEVREFRSRHDGYVYAAAPAGDVELKFESYDPPGGGRLLPWDDTVAYTLQAQPDVEVDDIVYLGGIHLSVEPTVALPGGGRAALAGADVTVAYRGSELASAFTTAQQLAAGDQTVAFEFRFPGVYQVTVTPPAVFDGWPVAADVTTLPSRHLGPGASRVEHAHFRSIPSQRVTGNVLIPGDQQLPRDLGLQFAGDGGILIRQPAGTGGPFEAVAPAGIALTISLDPGAGTPEIEGIPLEMSTPGQDLVRDSDNAIVLQYEHAIIGDAVDEAGNPLSNAVIDVFDDKQQLVRSVVADGQGFFTVGLADRGDYFVAVHTTDGGESLPRTEVSVQSPPARLPKPLVARRGRRGGGGAGAGGNGAVREAFTDLASYPVLTEEIITTGPPAPAGGAPGGAGADYGTVVGQVMRDVLGWRPSADVSGFQAALTGAFALREVEGHTEWTWQQRGYAVQADMGALTGAQASIYTRAKAAVDQIQPLLAGLVPLDPSLYPPQDLETIRTVVAAELNDLVSELGLAGGPRLQRVDELFGLLLGEGDRPSLNPDRVTGQLGTLRERFGLTVANVQTIDEERVITDFRVIVDLVLSLDTSWQTDRKLFSRDVFSGKASKTSFGTTLIWLSRSLEAVVESVDDLNFALDSVFVDAAQRQVIELRFHGIDEDPIILSDLLDWVVRACRDEGPRAIQDAGKDGVVAFSTVLEKLRVLVHETINIGLKDGRLPQGIKTPRVDRAFKVLDKQLHEAANLATSVRQDEAPVIRSASPQGITYSESGTPHQAVQLLGRNFRTGAATVFTPLSGGTERRASETEVGPPNFAFTVFSGDWLGDNPDGIDGHVSLINEDGTQSNPFKVNLGGY
jgi:hypothetical protein